MVSIFKIHQLKIYLKRQFHKEIQLQYIYLLITMQDPRIVKCRKFKCLGIQPNMFITVFLLLLSDFVFIYQFVILRANNKPYFLPLIIVKSIFSLLSFIALIMAFCTDPGKVPQHWVTFYSVQQKSKRRYCLICKQFKPLRTHHCSFCQKCVLNLDHHCPWVSNCVGLNNRKFFLLFLFFIIADHIFAMAFGLPMLIMQFINISNGIQTVTAHTIFRLLSTILCLLIIVPVIMFTGLHIQMAFNNINTIQDMKKQRKSQEDKQQQYQYNVGCYENFTQICGVDSICWFCPVSPNLQVDGIQWPSVKRDGDIQFVK